MREREAGDSLLDLGEGWEPIKGVRGSRKSSRTASDPRSARPPCPVCLYGSCSKRERLRVWSVPSGRRTGLTA